MRSLLLGLCLVAAPAYAADPVVEHLLDTMDDAACNLEDGVRALTFNLVDLDLEVRHRTARLRLGPEPLHLDETVVVGENGARVSTRLRMRLGSHEKTVELPDFYLVPRRLGGSRYLELRVPFFECRF